MKEIIIITYKIRYSKLIESYAKEDIGYTSDDICYNNYFILCDSSQNIFCYPECKKMKRNLLMIILLK